MIPTIEDIFHALSRGEMTFDDAENYVHAHITLAGRPAINFDDFAREEEAVRDAFAGQAMQGLLACSNANFGWSPDRLVERAYEYADAMLAERAK